jgi:hypothetical protein
MWQYIDNIHLRGLFIVKNNIVKSWFASNEIQQLQTAEKHFTANDSSMVFGLLVVCWKSSNCIHSDSKFSDRSINPKCRDRPHHWSGHDRSHHRSRPVGTGCDTGSGIFHVQLPNQMHHTSGDRFSPVCRPTPDAPVTPPVGTGPRPVVYNNNQVYFVLQATGSVDYILSRTRPGAG